MTKTHKLLTLALGAMILFAACGKEDDKPSSPTDPAPDGEKKLEYWEWLNYETDGTSTWGGFGYYKFSWDNGLLKKMESFNDDGQSESSCEIIYENGKAKEIREYEAPGELRCAYTLLYTGDRVTGAVHSNGGEVTNSYNAAGELVKQTLTFDDGGTHTTYLTWENGNVVEVREIHNYDSRTSTYSYTYTYTYDNKINPLRSAMSTLVAALMPPSGWLSKNNAISETRIDNAGEQSVRHSTYTYGGDYPTSMTQEWTDDIRSYKDRSYFRYTDGSGMSISSQVCRIRIETGSEGWPYADGDGEYLKGDTVIISANPEYYDYNGGTHYTFSRWSDGNTDNPRTFVATADMTFQPVYEPAGE